MKIDKLIKVLTPILFILVIACIVALVMLMINGPRPMLYGYDESLEDRIDSPAYLPPTPDYGEYYVNEIVYLCDTTLSGMAEAEVLRYGKDTCQIWTGTDGDMPLSASSVKTEILFPESGETIYIPDAAAKKLPQYVVIALGINNGVRYCTEEQFKTYYSAVITAIKEASPETNIILQSVLPVSKSYERKTQGITAEKIDRANGWIVELAEEHNVKYLNTASCLKSKSGYLDKKYDSGDGLHLNTEGYLAVLNYIRTHGYVSTAKIPDEAIPEETQ